MTLVVLDTNVISEAMRGAAASPHVIAWLRRTDLRAAAESAFDGLGVCLPLTSVAAEHYAQVVAHRRDAGRPIGGMDALIAAITRQNGAALATRDIAGFAELGIDLIDPWAYRA